VQYKETGGIVLRKRILQGLFFVKMTPIMNQLNGNLVIRRYININAVSWVLFRKTKIVHGCGKKIKTDQVECFCVQDWLVDPFLLRTSD
jgi:hypothetical protein